MHVTESRANSPGFKCINWGYGMIKWLQPMDFYAFDSPSMPKLQDGLAKSPLNLRHETISKIHQHFHSDIHYFLCIYALINRVQIEYIAWKGFHICPVLAIYVYFGICLIATQQLLGLYPSLWWSLLLVVFFYDNHWQIVINQTTLNSLCTLNIRLL